MVGCPSALPIATAGSQSLHPQKEGLCPGKSSLFLRRWEERGDILLPDCLPSWEPQKIRMQKVGEDLDEH